MRDGKVFVTGTTNPGKLYQIDPTLPAGAVTTLSSSLGVNPVGIGYDGQQIWTANEGSPGSVSIITLNPTSVATVTTGFNSVLGVIYDGSNIWVTDTLGGKLHKLDSTGAILLSVDVGSEPFFPAFDGTNIWVPNYVSNTVSVVRAAGGFAGTVIATLSGNGLSAPTQSSIRRGAHTGHQRIGKHGLVVEGNGFDSYRHVLHGCQHHPLWGVQRWIELLDYALRRRQASAVLRQNR